MCCERQQRWEPLGLTDAVTGGACEGRLDVVERGGVKLAKGLHVGL
jgi:hypothetical protein